MAPKSIVRDLHEQAMTFGEYITHYGLKRSEGVVLRYLGDVYKGLVQNVPEEHKTEEVYDLTEWLGTMVRQVDSSLIDEWERLTNPDPEDGSAPVRSSDPDDVTTNKRAFKVMVRNQAFRWVIDASRDFRGVDERYGDNGPTTDELGGQLEPYWDMHDHLITDADARGPEHFVFDASSGEVRQTIVDPDESGEWRLIGHVDLDQSREQGHAVVVLDRVENQAAI